MATDHEVVLGAATLEGPATADLEAGAATPGAAPAAVQSRPGASGEAGLGGEETRSALAGGSHPHAGPPSGPGCSKHELWRTQIHPDADVNVHPKLKSDGPCECLCNVLLFLPIFLVLLALLIVAPFPMVFVVVPLWLCMPGCLLSSWDIEEESNHEPAFMAPEPRGAGASAELPAKLRGVFYVRCADQLLCFEKGTWDAARKTLLLPAYAPRALTFKAKLASALKLALLRVSRTRLQFQFKEDDAGNISEATIQVKILFATAPRMFIHAGMTDVSKDKDGSLWEQWKLVMGRKRPSYWLQRVLDEGGAETPYLQHVKEELTPKCLCLRG